MYEIINKEEYDDLYDDVGNSKKFGSDSYDLDRNLEEINFVGINNEYLRSKCDLMRASVDDILREIKKVEILLDTSVDKKKYYEALCVYYCLLGKMDDDDVVNLFVV